MGAKFPLALRKKWTIAVVKARSNNSDALRNLVEAFCDYVAENGGAPTPFTIVSERRKKGAADRDQRDPKRVLAAVIIDDDELQALAAERAKRKAREQARLDASGINPQNPPEQT